MCEVEIRPTVRSQDLVIDLHVQVAEQGDVWIVAVPDLAVVHQVVELRQPEIPLSHDLGTPLVQRAADLLETPVLRGPGKGLEDV
ncbi:hypothetical protein D9M70_540060 [compost metagenome]